MGTEQARLLVVKSLMMAAVLFCSGLLQADAYFDRYGLTPASPAVDLGVQPLGYPSGVISAVMQRDRILKKALADAGRPLALHPFRRGADMLPLLQNRRLEAGLLGDMPTIVAAATGQIWIAGLVKQSATAIVAKGDVLVHGLAGKRIGYVEASSAHYTLLQGLASAGISEAQVKLVPLGVEEMPEALERGRIDAFAAWEPAPSIALGKNENNRIVFRGSSTDYFVLDRAFAMRSPEVAHHLVAGYLRAVLWMRRSQRNIEKAALWAMAECEAFSGKPSTLSVMQIVGITRREIINIPSAPTILQSAGVPLLKNEFEFLSKQGKLPVSGKWENVAAAFTYDGLVRISAEPRKYQLATFDYED